MPPLEESESQQFLGPSQVLGRPLHHWKAFVLPVGSFAMIVRRFCFSKYPEAQSQRTRLVNGVAIPLLRKPQRQAQRMWFPKFGYVQSPRRFAKSILFARIIL